ncbi:MAG: pantetheine-phosphate adenylyltransferase [Fimbriimonadaceae bacterium]|nr:pantetheine-phosphate adenylyltransferase [Chitinophagales bacterium]
MNNHIALFPGSFDPITIGHIDIINRSIDLFDKIIIAVGVNAQKKNYFTLEMRLKWLHEIFQVHEKIEITNYEGLTVNFCKEKNAQFILRGLRNTIDFEYEKTIAALNRSVEDSIETIFVMTAPEYSHINSTIVRELIRYKGKFDHLVPACVMRDAMQQ